MNRIVLIGRLSSEPEVRQANGKNVTMFNLAVDRYKDATDFIPCVAWEKRGDTIAQYCHKGDRLAVGGRLQIRQYKDRNGETRSIAEVVIEDFDLIQPKREEPKQTTSEDLDTFVPF